MAPDANIVSLRSGPARSRPEDAKRPRARRSGRPGTARAAPTRTAGGEALVVQATEAILHAGAGCAGAYLPCCRSRCGRRLRVRHWRPGRVDRRRLCEHREGRHLDRRVRHRRGGRRHRQPARPVRASPLPPGPSAVPIALDNAEANLAESAPTSQLDQGELPATCWATSPPSRPRSTWTSATPTASGPRCARSPRSQPTYDQARCTLQPTQPAEARFAQEQARRAAAAKLDGNPDIAGRRSTRTTCRPRRRSTRRSASSTTRSSGRRSPAS